MRKAFSGYRLQKIVIQESKHSMSLEGIVIRQGFQELVLHSLLIDISRGKFEI